MRLRHAPGLASRRESITTIEKLRQARVSRALHIALTAGGMRALGVAESVIDGFSAEFIAGLAGDEGRSRRLGDVGTSAPSLWRWGGPQEPHMLLMLYAEENLDAWRASDRSGSRQWPCRARPARPRRDMGGEEPFGFMDGVSQPRIDWSGEREPGTTADLDYGNLLTAGEFLLGYRNEYGLYTDRPLLDPEQPGATTLPIAEDDPARRDLGRNGSYLVMRELAQDVRGFWRFIMAQAADADAGDSTGAGVCGAADVGRCTGSHERASRSVAWVRTNLISRATSSPMTRTRRVCTVRSARMFAVRILAPAICRADARVWWRGCSACWASVIRT